MQVKLSEVRLFDHGRTCTLWLDPSSSKELSQLQGKLLEAFPDCTDLNEDPSRGITEFTPHLSLGQWAGSKAAQTAQQVYSLACSCLWQAYITLKIIVNPLFPACNMQSLAKVDLTRIGESGL